MKRVLKKPVVYSIYGLSFCLLLGGIMLLEFSSNNTLSKEEDNYQYVSKTVFQNSIPVVSNVAQILKPYTQEDVTIVQNYYDPKSDEESQRNSIIYYENTYLQSTGVSYGKKEVFEVVSILDGTVKEVKEDTTLGNVIIIEHENGIVSTYESITEIAVKQGDAVSQGQVIAKSGTSNISKDLNNHLYFELAINGVTVNPENYYNKSVNEL